MKLCSLLVVAILVGLALSIKLRVCERDEYDSKENCEENCTQFPDGNQKFPVSCQIWAAHKFGKKYFYCWKCFENCTIC